MRELVSQTVKFLEDKGMAKPEIGIVLGTGLGKLVGHIHAIATASYNEIPNFVQSTVESHPGKLVYGELEGKKVLAMQGRFHYYEGYNMQQITFPIRVMKGLGVETALLSNAAGALNPAFKKGSLMLIDDHINLLPENPLRGKNDDSAGPRFPDMSCPYSRELNQKLIQTAVAENIGLHVGVYASVQGPNLETRAEYRYLRTIGADAVGMSTVPEVIVANYLGMSCAAVSVLTDECDPDNLEPANVAEILEIAGKAEPKLIALFRKLVQNL